MEKIPYPVKARAIIRGGSLAPSIYGVAEFMAVGNNTLVTVRLRGLPDTNSDGFYAFHIHNGTSCGGTNFSQAGTHFSKTDEPHPRHAGDLPPILSVNSQAYMSVLTNRFSISDILGKAVILHSRPDDFTSQPSGNSGERLACGIIM